MAHRLLRSLCGGDDSDWQGAGQAAVECLQARLELRDGIHEAMERQKNPVRWR